MLLETLGAETNKRKKQLIMSLKDGLDRDKLHVRLEL